MAEPLLPKPCKVPELSKCTKCDASSKHLTATVVPVGGPYSGWVSCNSCGFRESKMNHIAKSMISVTPIPDGTHIIED